MADNSGPVKPPKVARGAGRIEREAAALRRNLQRRKQQSRGREAEDGDSEAQTSAGAVDAKPMKTTR